MNTGKSQRIAQKLRFAQEAYKQQLDRLERKYQLLLKDPTDQDLMLSFFQDCWHMKDWLLNSTNLSKKDLINFISNTLELQICREICNTSKHLILNKHAKKDGTRLATVFDPTALAREYNPRGNRLRFLYFSDKSKYDAIDKYDAIELAGVCLEKWKYFVNSRL